MRQHTTNIELLFYEIEISFLFNELVNSESIKVCFVEKKYLKPSACFNRVNSELA